MTSQAPQNPSDEATEAEVVLTPLSEPREGLPPLITTDEQLAQYVEKLRQGSGPVAVDAERASGYKYSQRAYLVQIRREGAGTALIDPIAQNDLSAITEACGDAVWILHAADQDLRCLAEVGMSPPHLFDTELAGRLLGYERVGLAAVVAKLLGLELAKEHSAADWSQRPLPDSWLTYAALDVEVLIEIYHLMRDELEQSNKLAWAEQEFEAIRTAPAPAPRVDPWLRTSGVHKIRDPRGLAIVRALWYERDKIAQRRDVTPSRVLTDKAIVAAATTRPRSVGELVKLPVFSGPRQRRVAPRWFKVIEATYKLETDELPTKSRHRDGPPHQRYWKDREPEAFKRLSAARAVVSQLSDKLKIPVENLMQPDALRRFCWQPPAEVLAGIAAASDTGGNDADLESALAGAREMLTGLAVRPWQIGLVIPPVLKAWAKGDVTD